MQSKESKQITSKSKLDDCSLFIHSSCLLCFIKLTIFWYYAFYNLFVLHVGILQLHYFYPTVLFKKYCKLHLNVPKFVICQSKTLPTVLISCEINSLVSHGYDIMVTWPNLGKVNVWFQKIAILTPRRVIRNSKEESQGWLESQNFQGYVGTKTGISRGLGGCIPKPLVGRVWIFSGTTQYTYLNLLWHALAAF